VGSYTAEEGQRINITQAKRLNAGGSENLRRVFSSKNGSQAIGKILAELSNAMHFMKEFGKDWLLVVYFGVCFSCVCEPLRSRLDRWLVDFTTP
jgi:hypothetical protein